MVRGNLQQQLGQWHRKRFPRAGELEVAMKLCEEAAEAGKEVNRYIGNNIAQPDPDFDNHVDATMKELADTVVVAMVLAERYLDGTDLMPYVWRQLSILNDPNGLHPASLRFAPTEGRQ